MLPETYTFPFEMTTWAVVEIGQMGKRGRWGDGQKTGRGGMAPGMLLTICFGIAVVGKKEGPGANKPFKHSSVSHSGSTPMNESIYLLC